MAGPNDTTGRLLRERDTAREAGEILARAVARFVHSGASGADCEPLKRALYAYMLGEALVDRAIFSEMAATVAREKGE